MRLKSTFFLGICALALGAGCGSLQTRPETAETPPVSTNSEGPGPAPTAPVSSWEGKTDDAIVRLEHLPEKYQKVVMDWVNYFQGRGRHHMVRYLSRSTRYLPMMKKVLRENGLPEDLVYISLIESGYSPRAHSHAGAVGYWQFMRGTGRNYGLRVNHLVDDRMDPEKSTEAAASYFKGLYNLFGSWPLAIAAYNVGENRIKGVVMRKYTRDLWELIDMRLLPKETAHYVPKFIAAEMIARDPAKFGFGDIQYEEPFRYDAITSTRSVDLKKFSDNLGIPFEEMRRLNPAYRTPLAPTQDGRLVLRVPSGTRQQAVAVLDRSFPTVQDERKLASNILDFRRYKVRPGDTLSGIARRHGVSLEALKAANSFSRGKVLRVGSVVEIPATSGRQRQNRGPRRSSSQSSVQVKSRVYVVRRGDTLSGISRKYEVPIYRLAQANNMPRQGGQLSVGKRLVIPE